MSRLRQINSQNYNNSGAINDEFESLVRYINSAEVGNKTVAELMDILFDDEGVFDANVELRLDTTEGLQYRTGAYTSPETGWKTIAAIDDVRGNSGVDYGSIGQPVFNDRYEFTATGGETEVDVAHDLNSEFLVYINGVFQTPGASYDYTSNINGGTDSQGSITFTTPLTASDVVVIYKVQANVEIDYTRTDFDITVDQAAYPFVHESTDPIQVYVNGVLQTAGVSNDYILDPSADLVIFNSAVTAPSIVSILTIRPLNSNITVAGLMAESNYTDLNGYIQFSKIAVADGEIGQAKVNGLVSFIADTPSFSTGATTPNPVTDFWLDTSSNPNQLKFYTGSNYLSANPASALPTFDENNANQYLTVDATGTILEYADLDFSTLVPKTQKGTANGVASLDSSARIPANQLPETIAYSSENVYVAGAVTDGSQRVRRYYKHEVVINAIEVRTDGGTCDVQIEIDGVPVGSTYAASVTPNAQTLSTPITVDATLSSKLVTIAVSNSAAPTNLDVVLSVKVQSQ